MEKNSNIDKTLETDELNMDLIQPSSSFVSTEGNKDSSVQNGRSYSLNYRMIPSKLSYVFTFAVLGSYHPFLIIFLKSIGLSVSQAGCIAGIRMLVSCFSNPCWNVIGDCTRRNRYIFMVICVASALLIFPMPWIADDVKNIPQFAGKNCSKESDADKTLRGTSLNKTCGNNMLFFVMLTVNIAGAAFSLAIPDYIDPIVVNLVKTSKKNVSFTWQRIFGALGFGCAALLSGVIADYYKPLSSSPYSGIFFVYLPSIICLIIASQFLFKQNNSTMKQSDNNTKSFQTLFLSLAKICCNLDMLIFLLTVIIMGAASGLLFGYLFLLLEELNSSKSLMGLSLFISSLAEFFIYPWMSKIMKTLKGPLPSIAIGVFSYFVRFLLFSYLSNAWIVLPIQLLHSFGYALFWEAVLNQVKQVCPKQLEMLMLALVHTLYFSLGFLVGFLTGGFLYDKFKGKLLYRGSAYFMLIWTVILFIQICVMKCRKQYLLDSLELNELSDSDKGKLTLES